MDEKKNETHEQESKIIVETIATQQNSDNDTKTAREIALEEVLAETKKELKELREERHKEQVEMQKILLKTDINKIDDKKRFGIFSRYGKKGD